MTLTPSSADADSGHAHALIMAGGCSLRMRASLGGRHKAMVEVLGVSMLERNIMALLAHGFTRSWWLSAPKKRLSLRLHGDAQPEWPEQAARL